MAQLEPYDTRRALLALEAFSESESYRQDPATWVADLLGDLLHYCDQNAVDFEDSLDRARGYFAEEIAERTPDAAP